MELISIISGVASLVAFGYAIWPNFTNRKIRNRRSAWYALLIFLVLSGSIFFFQTSDQRTDINDKSFSESKNNQTLGNQSITNEISTSLFLSQLNKFDLDSDKIKYIREYKKIMNSKITFNEFNNILSEMNQSSNKIIVATHLISYTIKPQKDELDKYMSQFHMDSYKKKALDIIYKK
ncbi:MAG: DUF4476 domain-containing protein [Candidatus Electrothrix sp. Rat3]|nr:DUF4476 domain-containing protein [Candidatus Electrothrix rattekaaiensis]